MTFCHRCQKDQHPAVDFQADGTLVEQCPECQAPLAMPEAPPVAAPAVVAKNVTAKAAPASEPAPWDALLEGARARLAFCEAEIAKRDGFLAERDMLRKMLAAADGETKPAATLPLN